MARETFGQLLKRLRIATGKTLRAFCLEGGLDPGNLSKMERDLNGPPKSDQKLGKLAQLLSLEPGTEVWQLFFDVAASDAGKIPQDLLKDEGIVEKLPILFRTLRGTATDVESLDDLVEKIRKA